MLTYVVRRLITAIPTLFVIVTFAFFLIRIAPKWGSLKILKFRIPDRQAENMFLESFDATVTNYGHVAAQTTGGHIELPNVDWDTGKKTMQGEYSLADKTYSDWVIRLKEKKFATIDPSIKKNILAFYKNQGNSDLNDDQWQQTSAALEELKNGE